ncbi:unnamed protein product [Dicrocoelium dendriticum]|nr:unnamed protein product [Dicrocoelium dendriticum]
MESTIALPEWYRKSIPLHAITADCVLEWPDESNCNEFPVICPVHGILSRWCLKPDHGECTCGSSTPGATGTNADSSENLQRVTKSKRTTTSIQQLLQQLWKGENIPCLLKERIRGTPADPGRDRHAAFMGNQLRLTPRGPVIVNSHSLRALLDCNSRQPDADPKQTPLGSVYAYLEDLGLWSEWCAVFKSQLRHVVPNDVVIRTRPRIVTIYRKPGSSGILVNIFPGLKCFVTRLDYSEFAFRPELNYGDQLLELYHCILQRGPIQTGQEPKAHDVFHLRIRRCPFLKWLTIAMGPCPLVTEKPNFIASRENLMSYLDMGFSIHKGRVTAVAAKSPAQACGLEPDHHIVEVAGTFTAHHTDERIIGMLRQHIKGSPTRTVEIVVIPERIHAQLCSVQNLHHVVSNEGFNIDSWVQAAPFGFR